MKYSVSIAETVEGDIVSEVYAGDDFQEALDQAFNARDKKEWRGKFIRFESPDRLKWARIS